MGFLNCLSKLVNCYASKMGYNGIIKVNVEKMWMLYFNFYK